MLYSYIEFKLTNNVILYLFYNKICYNLDEPVFVKILIEFCATLDVHYTIKAQLIAEKMSEFYGKLTDGSISSQKPDGAEIISSMNRAKITSPGIVEWSEQCFCNTPLKHERETVYDKYFEQLETVLVDDYVEISGEPFMKFLENQ